ncbi:MAG: D-2-hydroxyacid dehydrogenase [Clostridia bacterium]|nr:D-2-hydroxyacid dehydrogenase [Clostridia bacterium]
MIHAVILDGATLGEDISFASLEERASLTVYPLTPPEEVAARIRNAQVVIVNKIRLNEANLAGADALKLICVAATGYDNIDVAYCRRRGIAVCNVLGYSTDSVAQLTVAMVLELILHLPEMSGYVRSGAYTASGVANRLTPAFHELAGRTWGIIGAGNIGKKVARIAETFGCRVLVCRRRPDPDYPAVDIDTLCREADIISVHTPLTDETRGLISRERIAAMKPGVIVVNVARGAVADEAALADAVRTGQIGGLGVDVYSAEPLPADHPLYAVRELPNVCFTPHMAWGAVEARQRCIDEIAENIRAFFAGECRCRVDR